MPILIEYLPAELAARLSVQGSCPPAHWVAVRRACEDHSEDVIHDGEHCVRLPWWRFAALRGVLAFLRQQYGIDFVYSPEARHLMLEARHRQEEFGRPSTQSPLPEEVQERLTALHFKRTLNWYQLRNVARLAALPAAATFSVPGAGKTTEALATFMLTRQEHDRLLVIAPKNAFIAWEEES